MGREVEESSFARTAATAALVLLGCYLGASADIWLRFPDVGAAILFPPYAILTAALWRTEPRTWWVFLLAATAGNYLPHRLGGASIGFVLLSELVNDLRAVLAAVALRRFAGRDGRVETLREMVAFLLAAVFLAPAAAALAGAGLVIWQGVTRSYWLAWQEWWFSNAITALTLLPLLATDLAGLRALRVPARRANEALLLTASLLAVGVGVFARTYDRSSVHLAHLYWAIPFLLWAARFGTRGTSAALLAVTALSVWGAIDGRGPFAARSAMENLLELQVFLLAVSIPLLLLAALVEQQRRTAAALSQSRRQYRSVIEDQTEMICRFRPDGATTFANRAYIDAFGLGDTELVGSGVWNQVPPGVHSTPYELGRLSPASPISTREVCVTTAAGTRRWQHWRERGLFDESGALVEIQAVGRDVTDRKRAEDERRELEAQRSVEAALREADRRKDEFLAMLGHELRNPLAPIGIALEVLRQAPPGGAEALWARESIGRQLAHMTRLLDDLLDISRITLGKIRLQLETVDLGRVIANALEATRPFVDSHGHGLVVKVPEEPLLIRGDAVRLTQVVSNLLHNAAKYTDRGGRIEIAAEREGAGVRISVRDNGIGLTADALEKIFELFAQLPSGRERGQGGLGIGLTLVKRLVELHGGTVEARSDGPHLGSEIIVRLPSMVTLSPALATAADAPPEEREREPEPEPEPERERERERDRRGSLRILAVDDNVPLADGLANLLGLWGHTVRTAYDGDAALEVARTFAPEVVLVDLGLPRIDGLEVARRLREKAERPPALLVSMSGFGQDLTRRRSDEAGFHHHLVKPVDLGSLRSLLDDCLRNKSAPPS